MADVRSRSRWKKWLGLTLAGAVAFCMLVAVLLVGLLPGIVRRAFEQGAEALGFEEAVVEVPRADLSGLRTQALRLRRGGLEVALEQGEVDYSVRRLAGGQVSRVRVDGLNVTLDLIRPRRGLLPDDVAELQAQFDGEGELEWPVDELVLENTRLVFNLPGGSREIHFSGTARRQPDGKVAVDLRAQPSDQTLHVSGTVHTETMSGTITLREGRVDPMFLLGFLRELGALTLPPATDLAAEPVAVSGELTLTDGAIESFSGSLRAPRIRGDWSGQQLELTDLEVTAAQASGAPMEVQLTANVQGREQAQAWAFGPAHVELHLRNGEVTARLLEPAAFAVSDSARGAVSLALQAGIPAMSGESRAEVTLRVTDLLTPAGTLAPVTLELAGWTNEATLTIDEVRLLDSPVPLALRDFRASGARLLEASRTVEGVVQIQVEPRAAELLPASWILSAPTLPADAAQVDFRVTPGDSGPIAEVRFHSQLPRLRVAMEDVQYGVQPQLEAKATVDPTGVSVDASLGTTGIEFPLTSSLPAVDAVSLNLHLDRINFEDLSALVEELAPVGAMQATLNAVVTRGSRSDRLGLTLRHLPESAAWSGEGVLSLAAMSGSLPGAAVEELSGQVTIDTGPITRSQLEHWLTANDRLAMFAAALAQAEIEVALGANRITFPGSTQAEWLTASLKKPPIPTSSAAPLTGILSARAGIVRTGPETLEQPELTIDFSGDLTTQRLSATLKTLVEGAPLELNASHLLALDANTGGVRGKGAFVLKPLTLANSDVITRWDPTLPAVAVSGTLEAEVELHHGGERGFDGRGRLSLRHGIATYPPQKLRIEGASAAIEIDSLADLQTGPGQEVRVARLELGEIVARDVRAHFWTEGPTILHIQDVAMGIFDGELTAEPFSLYFPDPDVALDLRMQGLDANELVRTFEIFDGNLTGRLRGRLPVGLLAGRPIIGEGFLELEEEHPARFSFDTAGFFAAGLPERTLLEQVNRLPYELIDDGLRSLELKRFRVDLFRRDRPGTPIDISFSGTAHTRRADVPMNIDVRINGSTREVLERILEVVMK